MILREKSGEATWYGSKCKGGRTSSSVDPTGGNVMYIREIARSLYQLKKRLEELEQACNSAPLGEKREELERELAKTRLEYERVKNILEGAKESPSP